MFRKNAYAQRQSLILAGAIAGSIAIASSAVAGECPADKMKPNVRAMVDFKPVGLTDVTLGSIALGKQPAHIEGRELRFRKTKPPVDLPTLCQRPDASKPTPCG